jgi:hypothetical protein
MDATKKKHVVWTTDEEDRIARQVWMTRTNRPHDSLIQIVKDIQQQLPATRRKHITTQKHISGITRRVAEIDREYVERAEENERLRNKIASLQAKIADPKTCLDDVLDEELLGYLWSRLAAALRKSGRLDEFLWELPFPELVGYVMKRWAGSIEGIENVVAEMRLSRPEDAPQRPSHKTNGSHVAHKPEAVREPVVVIYGTLPGQQNAIRQKASPNRLLRFISKDLNDPTVPHASAYVLWTNFIDHATRDKVRRSAPEGAKIIEVRGGISSLVEAIERL